MTRLLLGLVLLSLPAAASEKCAKVVFEYVNTSKAPVRVSARYRVTHPKGEEVAFNSAATVKPGDSYEAKSDCLPAGTTVSHAAEVDGKSADSRNFTMKGAAMRCRVVAGPGGVNSHHCEAVK